MAILRTIDPAQGLLELLVAPAFHCTALELLQFLADEMELDLLEPQKPIIE